MKEKVVVDPHFRRMDEVFASSDRARLYQMAEVVWGRDEQMPIEAIAQEREEVVAVLSANWRHGDVRDFPRLRAIIELSGRFPDQDTLDYEACFARGIRVLSCAPAFAPVVAEMALATALAGARRIVEEDTALRAGTENWGWQPEQYHGAFSLFDQPVGFIGYGNIARTLQTLLEPFHCPIRVYDPWLTGSYLEMQGVLPTSLENLLETSQVVFVLAAPTDSNQFMLNRARLERMPQGALLILISRAYVADFDALTDLLYAGRIRAAIDVFPTEPLPLDHPIRRAPNTVLTAHRAGGTAQGHQFIGNMVVNDLEALLAGNPPQQLQVAQPEIIRKRGAVKK